MTRATARKCPAADAFRTGHSVDRGSAGSFAESVFGHTAVATGSHSFSPRDSGKRPARVETSFSLSKIPGRMVDQVSELGGKVRKGLEKAGDTMREGARPFPWPIT